MPYVISIFFCHMEGTVENVEHSSPEEIEEVFRIASPRVSTE
jgi:hypothetical protein